MTRGPSTAPSFAARTTDFAQDDDELNVAEPQGDQIMQDILWIAVTIVFFVLSIAYVRFCERVK